MNEDIWLMYYLHDQNIIPSSKAKQDTKCAEFSGLVLACLIYQSRSLCSPNRSPFNVAIFPPKRKMMYRKYCKCLKYFLCELFCLQSTAKICRLLKVRVAYYIDRQMAILRRFLQNCFSVRNGNNSKFTFTFKAIRIKYT